MWFQVTRLVAMAADVGTNNNAAMTTAARLAQWDGTRVESAGSVPFVCNNAGRSGPKGIRKLISDMLTCRKPVEQVACVFGDSSAIGCQDKLHEGSNAFDERAATREIHQRSENEERKPAFTAHRIGHDGVCRKNGDLPSGPIDEVAGISEGDAA